MLKESACQDSAGHAPPLSTPDLFETLYADEHLARFAQLHPDKARMQELRLFAGLTMARIAALTGQSEKTVRRHWTYARSCPVRRSA